MCFMYLKGIEVSFADVWPLFVRLDLFIMEDVHFCFVLYFFGVLGGICLATSKCDCASSSDKACWATWAHLFTT